MPRYEYDCPKCQKSFELTRPIAEWDQLGNCPECGQEGCQKVITAHGSYSIKGDNSASITPKRFRGNSA